MLLSENMLLYPSVRLSVLIYGITINRFVPITISSDINVMKFYDILCWQKVLNTQYVYLFYAIFCILNEMTGFLNHPVAGCN